MPYITCFPFHHTLSNWFFSTSSWQLWNEADFERSKFLKEAVWSPITIFTSWFSLSVELSFQCSFIKGTISSWTWELGTSDVTVLCCCDVIWWGLTSIWQSPSDLRYVVPMVKPWVTGEDPPRKIKINKKNKHFIILVLDITRQVCNLFQLLTFLNVFNVLKK